MRAAATRVRDESCRCSHARLVEYDYTNAYSPGPMTGDSSRSQSGRQTIPVAGLDHALLTNTTPRQARTELCREILTALTRNGVDAFVIKSRSRRIGAIGVLAEKRHEAVEAVSKFLTGPAMYIDERYAGVPAQPMRPLSGEVLDRIPERCNLLRVSRLWSTQDENLVYGNTYGITLEFWTKDDEHGQVIAPRANAAGEVFDIPEIEPAQILLEGEYWPSIKVFARTYLNEITFPIDLVYTWVDGSDIEWRRRFDTAKLGRTGERVHPEAIASHRYHSRDELRYSLRSIDMYAPWVRHIYLVTDDQVPSWLCQEHPDLTVVDHRDIYADLADLPVYNSSAIITQLHHIDGLSEHYLYMNDDMFFGGECTPETFWLGDGTAKVFPSRNYRPFIAAADDNLPHINISANIRSLIQEAFGISITTAIRHTPYPQIRSVNFELEKRFADQIAKTAGHRFRHKDDIALDQLFHYYAQVTGHAVPSTISYDYVNVGTTLSLARLRRLLAARDRAVFCLNDAPEDGDTPIDPAEISRFLRMYFPVKSRFEVETT